MCSKLSQEIEIEFKNLITKEEFNKILSMYSFHEPPVVQTNFYFDTPNFSLRNNHSALRIREKKGIYYLTLKETIQEGILETHDSLTLDEVIYWKNNEPVVKSNVAKQLNKLNIRISELIYYGSLTTKRTEYHHDQLIYVLDESNYNGQSDYELEIEAPTFQKGQVVFNNLLKTSGIPKRETPNKIMRFFSTLE